MWKVGSGARLLPPLPEDPRDSRDPRDPGMSSETSIFDNPSIDFEKHFGKHVPQRDPKLKKTQNSLRHSPNSLHRGYFKKNAEFAEEFAEFTPGIYDHDLANYLDKRG